MLAPFFSISTHPWHTCRFSWLVASQQALSAFGTLRPQILTPWAPNRRGGKRVRQDVPGVRSAWEADPASGMEGLG